MHEANNNDPDTQCILLPSGRNVQAATRFSIADTISSFGWGGLNMNKYISVPHISNCLEYFDAKLCLACSCGWLYMLFVYMFT